MISQIVIIIITFMSSLSCRMMNGHDNPTFVGDSVYSIPGEYRRNLTQFYPGKYQQNFQPTLPAPSTTMQVSDEKSHKKQPKERDSWGKGIEFLLSCIAMSVGLGNIWRFPFIALENGGGAFVIPYIIVLFLIGKPCYFMEMVMGQFSSRGSVKVFDCAPAMRGVGVGQVVSIAIVATYYSSLMALTLSYFANSFNEILPWSGCKSEWNATCIPSGYQHSDNMTWSNDTQSSAELYFLKDVLRAKDNIDDGVGVPNWTLVMFLAISWGLVFLTLIKGVRSSGKASYVLAIFPYVVLSILFVRAVTLPGAFNGIKYFLTPQWDKILEIKVWYAAVTQVFFSLSVCFGNIIMYASYNKFTHNVYRDANIVTTLDTFTSLLAGCCIFGILGHLAHELGVEDISTVVKSGAGLAFISYPDAITKFKALPQVFSVLFFLMLYLLGIGSNVAMMSCIMTVVRDRFKKVKNWHAALGFAIFGTVCGSVYMTPVSWWCDDHFYVVKLNNFFKFNFDVFEFLNFLNFFNFEI
jgi:solute carrier family 6 amino acid transporter-like protein 5/7/9/14